MTARASPFAPTGSEARLVALLAERAYRGAPLAELYRRWTHGELLRLVEHGLAYVHAPSSLAFGCAVAVPATGGGPVFLGAIICGHGRPPDPGGDP